MSIIINNASLLLGSDLTFVNNGFIEIGKNGIIKKVGDGNYRGIIDKERNTIDAEGFMIIPGFINAHTHIGDSIGKDFLIDSGLDERVHPVFGAKRNILQKTRPDHLKMFIRSSAISMMKKGIVAFADFREGGIEGVKLLKAAISDLPIKCVILGRVEYYFNPVKKEIIHREVGIERKDKKLSSNLLQMASDILKIADGFGISGANENTDETLIQYSKLLQSKNSTEKKKLLSAIHAAESKDTNELSKSKTGMTEVYRIMRYLKPDILVHMTNADEEDISMVAKKGTGVIVCPRSNGILGVGIPKVARMLKLGCTVGIGTDNVMLNSPDIFKELDYLWKASRATEPEFISPKEILMMATVNNAKILGLNSGYIENGRSADLLFIDKNHIDLYPIHEPYASIVHRASQDSIKAVMINGKFIDGVDI
ncbi:MAG: amidohydrolase family protein [Thermoproteota archaeon]|nr:amidohydrolase family protein [Thermoproteota archaeon]MDQ4023250.1 amidohydrolase family protein [Thermoproteota archaeon]